MVNKKPTPKRITHTPKSILVPPSGARETSEPFPVVGIGASAGGLESFTQLLAHLHADTGLAFVLVQHLDPKHPSILGELLARETPLPVHEIKNGMPIKPNQVYVIPPNHDLSIRHGTLQLTPRSTLRGLHTPIDSFFPVSAVLDVEPANVWGVDINQHEAPDADGAWGYDPPLKAAGDFDKLRVPVYRYNETQTHRLMERTGELIGDLLPPRLVCQPPFKADLGYAASLRGLEQIMLDAIDQPELLHRLLAVIVQAQLTSLDTLEKAGVLTPVHDLANSGMGPSIYSDPVGSIPPGRSATGANFWCPTNSQEFDQVSPAMWEEFCLDYQKKVFARFGLVCYGCCESLTRKIDGVLSIPNLRIVVCSAWTDKDVFLSKVPADRYVIMWRQKASEVCVPHDDAQIRNDLLEGAKRFQGRYYQIVLRELQTLMGHTGRLHAWVRYAKEAAEKYA